MDPAIDGAAVHSDPTLGKPLHDVGIAQAIADVPPDAKAMTSSGKPPCEKALVERAVKRRLQALQRQRCPPSRVCPSRRARSHTEYTPRPTPLTQFAVGHCTAHPVATIP